jgi:predicted permease
MLTVFLSLGTITLAGSALQRLFPDWNIEEFRKSINRLVLYVLLPALIFKVISTSDLDGVLYQVPFAAAAGIVGCLAVAWLVFRWIPLDARAKGALILACAFGNVTYLGLPVLQGVFPDQAGDISKVAILCEVTVAPLNLIVGSLLAMRFSGERGVNLRQSLKQVVQLPPLWALVAALLCKKLEVPVPEFILHGTAVLGGAVSGLMILSLGMALRFERVEHLVPTLGVGGIKLFLSPVIVFGAAKLLSMQDPYFEAVTLEGAMPTQLLTLVIADRFNLDSRLLARAIVINTVLAFVTIPLVRTLLFA